jgi:hypothetical protein
MEMDQTLENALDQPGTLVNMLVQLAINLKIVVSVISIPLIAGGVIIMESKDAMTCLGSPGVWEDAKRSLLALVKVITLVILALMALIASGVMQHQHVNLRRNNVAVVILTT